MAATAVPNSTLEKAFSLGVLASTQQFTGFAALGGTGSTIGGDGWSYYVVNAAPSVGPQRISLAVNTSQGVSLDVEIASTSGQAVTSQSGTGGVNLSFTSEGAGEAYVLRVRQMPSRSVTAAAAFNAVLSVSRNPVAEDIALSATVIAENRPAGSIVATLSAAIPGSSGGFTYELVAGEGAADNAAFAISGDQLTTARRFNFELRRTYSVRVRATDGGGQSTERSFTITVTDIVTEPLVVESITPPPPATFIAGQQVRFTVALSRRVAVSGRPRIEVQAGNVVRSAIYAAGSGSAVLTFQYVVGAADSFDSVSLGQRFLFPAGSRIVTAAMSLALRLPSGFAGAVAPGVRIDGRPPRFFGPMLVPAAGTYTVGQSLDFIARFSEAVVVTGSVVPRITLRGLNAPRVATYVSGSGTTDLTFRYVISQGDAIVSPAGLGLGATIVLPTGARIADTAGNRALLGITAPAMRQIRIDARVMASLASPQADAERSSRTGRIGAMAFTRLG